ncbi:MAG: CBS domain-containing protein [Bdellovibrionales bacterium]|nr:CBS domain-containing protein [Bdellovibrionales bacterium]
MAIARETVSSNARPRVCFNAFKLEPEKLVTIRPDATLGEAAELMRRKHLGDLIVTREGTEFPLGIVTDRDLTIRGLGGGAPSDLRVRDVMSGGVVCARETDDVFAMIELMRKHGIARLPVCGGKGDRIVGVVTARRAIRLLARALEDLSSIGDRQQAREHERHH